MSPWSPSLGPLSPSMGSCRCSLDPHRRSRIHPQRRNHPRGGGFPLRDPCEGGVPPEDLRIGRDCDSRIRVQRGRGRRFPGGEGRPRADLCEGGALASDPHEGGAPLPDPRVEGRRRWEAAPASRCSPTPGGHAFLAMLTGVGRPRLPRGAPRHWEAVSASRCSSASGGRAASRCSWTSRGLPLGLDRKE